MEQFIRYIQFRKELLENLLTEKTDIDKALRLELDWIESNIELDEISYSVWVRRNAELERERKRESLIPTEQFNNKNEKSIQEALADWELESEELTHQEAQEIALKFEGTYEDKIPPLKD